jgi:hypothetical protein
VAVGNQNTVQALETQARLHNLALGAFAAIDQETVFIMHHHLSSKPAARRWSGG